VIGAVPGAPRTPQMKRIRMRVWLRVFGSTSVRRTAMRLSAAAAATRSAQDYEAMRAGARVVSEIPGVDASMVVVAGGRLDLHACQGWYCDVYQRQSL